MAYCSKCGTKCLESSTFCANCGNRLISSIIDLETPQKIKVEDLRNRKKSVNTNQGHAAPSHLNRHPQRTAPLPSQNYPENNDSNISPAWIIGGVVLVIFILVIIFSGGSSSTARVEYSGCWSGAFSDGSMNIISISGCGNESFDCGSGSYCGINAQKQDDSSARLCVSVGSNEACTTAGYGVAQV